MGASTKTTSSNSTQTSTPWSVAIPGLMQAVGDATNLYNSGVGSGIYGGQRVAQFGTDTLTGLQSMRDQASSDNAGALGTSFAQGLLGSGGISATTQQGLGMLSSVPNVDTSRLSSLADYAGSASNPVNQTASGFMSGARDLTTEGDLRGLLSRALAPSAAETNLSGVASGQYLDPTTNPYLQAAVQAANQNATNAQKASFAASGRYGSGNFAAGIAKAVNDTDTQLYANQYNQERANQLAANSQIDSARQAGTQLGTGITNAISGVQSTNNSQRLAGAGLAQSQTAQQAGILGQVLSGDQFNSSLGVQKANGFISAGQTGQSQALQAAGLLPSLDALRYSPGQTLLGIGGAVQGQDQANIDAAMQLYQQQQQQPWASLDNFASLVGGIGGMGGTTTGTSQQTQKSDPGLLNSIIGGISGIAGIGGKLGSAAPFLSLLGLSDERAKEDIREVGRLHDGQPVYAYRYRGDPETRIGLMAQEVARTVPDAVGLMPDGSGYLGVDYRRATERSAAIARAAGFPAGTLLQAA